jgi:hypothetical protein
MILTIRVPVRQHGPDGVADRSGPERELEVVGGDLETPDDEAADQDQQHDPLDEVALPHRRAGEPGPVAGPGRPIGQPDGHQNQDADQAEHPDDLGDQPVDRPVADQR